jgi:hypothetical protein
MKTLETEVEKMRQIIVELSKTEKSSVFKTSTQCLPTLKPRIARKVPHERTLNNGSKTTKQNNMETNRISDVCMANQPKSQTSSFPRLDNHPSLIKPPSTCNLFELNSSEEEINMPSFAKARPKIRKRKKSKDRACIVQSSNELNNIASTLTGRNVADYEFSSPNHPGCSSVDSDSTTYMRGNNNPINKVSTSKKSTESYSRENNASSFTD